MSTFTQLLRQNLEANPVEDMPSADHGTRQPKVGEDTIVGFQVERGIPDKIPANADVYPTSTMPDLEKDIQYEGSVVFTTSYDMEKKIPSSRVTSRTQETKPYYRTTLAHLPVGTDIVPVGFFPKTEKPFQNAGRDKAVANMSVTGTFLNFSRYNKPIPAGSQLMAVAPTLDQLQQPHTISEAHGEFRPIWIPVDDVLSDLQNTDVILNPAKAKNGYNRSRLGKDRLRQLVEQFEKDLSSPARAARIGKQKLGEIIQAAALYGSRATRACKAIALEHSVPNKPALCQWKP